MKTPKQLLNHYFTQALYFYNQKQAIDDPFFVMYANMFWGAKSMTDMLSNDADLKKSAENFGDFLNEINCKAQKEIAEMLDKVKVDL